MTARLLSVALLALGLAAPALGTPYWIAWEGEDYPENDGWERIIEGDGPADRMLENGILTIDSLWSTQVADAYRMERQLNPGSGEEFVMQWRLRVNEVVGHPLYLFDPGLGLVADDGWDLDFHIGVNKLRSVHESIEIPFEPLIFHTFELRSLDMRTYQLMIDEAVAYSGVFSSFAVARSRVTWGDVGLGSASHTDWDYVRFGVVPEPASGLMLFGTLISARALGGVAAATRRGK